MANHTMAVEGYGNHYVKHEYTNISSLRDRLLSAIRTPVIIINDGLNLKSIPKVNRKSSLLKKASYGKKSRIVLNINREKIMKMLHESYGIQVSPSDLQRKMR